VLRALSDPEIFEADQLRVLDADTLSWPGASTRCIARPWYAGHGSWLATTRALGDGAAARIRVIAATPKSGVNVLSPNGSGSRPGTLLTRGLVRGRQVPDGARNAVAVAANTPTVWAFGTDSGVDLSVRSAERRDALARWQDEHKQSAARARAAGVLDQPGPARLRRVGR
jgi:hypothetical protein